MWSFSGVTFVFVLFQFLIFVSIETAALRLILLRYTRAPIATRSYLTTGRIYLGTHGLAAVSNSENGYEKLWGPQGESLDRTAVEPVS